MAEIRKTVWNGILYGNAFVIAQELESISEEYRRWVAIYANYKMTFVRTPYWAEHTDTNKKFSIVDF